jgi:hypothetical protein
MSKPFYLAILLLFEEFVHCGDKNIWEKPQNWKKEP